MGQSPSDPAAVGRLRVMMLIRRVEERLSREFTTGQKIGGLVHLYSGQEAIATGIGEIFHRGQDFLIANVRHHGHSIALGMPPMVLMAEMYGRAAGCCRGKAGSMHMMSRANGDLGGILRAGGQLPLGIGAAFSCAYRKTGGVCFALMGDGSVTTGAFSESLNLAGLWKLPAVFVVENNGITIGTRVERADADPNLLEHGRGYAMPCVEVDGNDVEAVIATVGQAADRARGGDGPTYIVAHTFRFRGYSMSDAMKYRTRQEIEEARRRDPISLYRRVLLQRQVMDEAAIEALREQVAAEVEAAIDAADASPNPPLEARWEDVIAGFSA